MGAVPNLEEGNNLIQAAGKWTTTRMNTSSGIIYPPAGRASNIQASGPHNNSGDADYINHLQRSLSNLQIDRERVSFCL